MMAIPAHRLLLVAFAAAALAFGALGCGDDDDSDSDSEETTTAASETGAETATDETATGDTATEAEEPAEAEGVFFSYRVTGEGVNPGGLGLEIDADGRGSYGIGEGKEITFRLRPNELDELTNALDRIPFSELPARIEPKDGEAIEGVGEIEVTYDGHVVREIAGRANSRLLAVHAAVARIIAGKVVQQGNEIPIAPGSGPQSD